LVNAVNDGNQNDDIEIVVVDNASSEENWFHLQQVASTHKNVRLFRNSVNIGMTPNWNKAIESARGDWIGFMCDDDMFKPDAISRVRRAISSVTEPCLILQNSALNVETAWIEPGVEAAKKVALPPASGQFWNRKLTERVGPFDERIRHCPDAEFWPRLAFHYPVLLVRDYWVIPYQHDTNNMWEAFKSPDFLEQVRLSIQLSSRWILGEKSADLNLVKLQVDDGIWETLRTVLNNTFMRRGNMKQFPKYFVEFIRYSFVLNRKWLMVRTIANLPVLKTKELVRGIINT
jgi:glycosyltransferase involved in cell wall biosynthesis